ncbi:M56 family metallopeptidase [Pedobacter frigoris]|uniref:M56 family metallopeptidase n=1 Tax=Pedobacter frigoris TaxID=2571272 RepID=UPI0029317CFF|nr:M56 family metallopeptidase [Pedobacter frigoris]
MEWLIYLLKVSACMALFYALYYLFLQRLTFFSFNRFYLLSALAVSFLIPALQLELERQVEVQEEVAQDIPMLTVESFAPVGVPNSVSEDSLFSEYSWQEITNVVYWLIAATMLVLFVYQMIQLLKHITKVNKRVGRLKVVYKPTGFTNCSFLNYVFVDQQDLKEEEIAVILQHEAVHANRLHSLDKLFVNVCKVFLWFNPLIYLYAQSLEQVHEYEADQEASSIIGNTSYANLLLTIAVRKNNTPLVHSFVKSPLKARIKMLFTNQSKNMKKLTYLTALPLSSILLWSFSVAYIDKPSMGKYSEETTYKALTPQPQDSVKYRQKVKWTPETEKARADHEAWMKTEDFKTKIEFSRSMMGKNVNVLVKGEVKMPAGSIRDVKMMVEYQNKDYYLGSDVPDGSDRITSLVKAGDKLDIQVHSFSFSQNPIMGITPEKIVKDGHLIYEMKMPKIDPNRKPAPFLYEANRVRYNDGVITKAGSVVAGKRTMEVTANGFKFIIKINSNQVALSELASFKQGDHVWLRFVHEVKTGAATYSITDWTSISKDMKAYGVKNKQMFYRFYEKVPTDQKAVNTNPSHQQEPFIKKSTKEYKDHVQYVYDVKSPKGKKMTIMGSDKTNPKFFVDGKVYSLKEAEKFDKEFIAELSATQGSGPAGYYDQAGLDNHDWVFWFGHEPKLKLETKKSREAFTKYQGKMLKVRVVDYSYSSVANKLMDGFYVETEAGEKLKVFIEAKYAKQINAQLKKSDLLTIIIQNVGYWKNENSIVIQSSKLVKNGKVLFDHNRPVVDERTGATRQNEVYYSAK